MIEHAKQRTQQIIEAYDLIRERRGIRSNARHPLLDHALHRPHPVGQRRRPRLQDDASDLISRTIAIPHRRHVLPSRAARPASAG